jgi:hypothetical protein
MPDGGSSLASNTWITCRTGEDEHVSFIHQYVKLCNAQDNERDDCSRGILVGLQILQDVEQRTVSPLKKENVLPLLDIAARCY